MTSRSEANRLVHYEDFNLARSVKRELMQLRSRPTMPTNEDMLSLARKAALADLLPRPDRAFVDNVRAEACLAICKLAAAVASNARLIEENRPDALANTSLLWARAIDLGQAWLRAAEQPRREPVDLTTTTQDIDARAIPALASVPRPAQACKVNDASAVSLTWPDNAGREIVKALEALPIGSALTFAADAFSVLRLVGAPIVCGTKAYRGVEHLGQACNCSCRLHDNAGTITFYR